jgi:hypothetical protein
LAEDRIWGELTSNPVVLVQNQVDFQLRLVKGCI